MIFDSDSQLCWSILLTDVSVGYPNVLTGVGPAPFFQTGGFALLRTQHYISWGSAGDGR